MFEIVMGIDDFLIQLVKYCSSLSTKSYTLTFMGSFFGRNSLPSFLKFPTTVLHQLDQKIIYPHYDFKHLTEKYFEIGMKLNDFSIQFSTSLTGSENHLSPSRFQTFNRKVF